MLFFTIDSRQNTDLRSVRFRRTERDSLAFVRAVFSHRLIPPSEYRQNR